MAAVLSRASSATRPTVAAIHVFRDARSSRRDSAMTAAATRHTPAAAAAHELNATRSSHFMRAALARRSSAYRFAATRHLRSADRTERASCASQTSGATARRNSAI